MFSIWVTLEIDPADEEAFLAAITHDAEHSVADEPGCLGFDVIALDRAAGKWAFYERYVDGEAFEVDHQAAPHYRVWAETEARVVRPGTLVVTIVETVVDQHK